MPLPRRPLAMPLLLLVPAGAAALNATAEGPPSALLRPHLHATSATGMLDRLRTRTSSCPTWCRMSHVHWEQKCKWQKCSSGGCWDCEWSESAKAYNYELARVRREVRDSSGSDALQEALQKGRDDARQQDQGRRMATTRVKLGRQREAERRKEEERLAAENWKLALELQKNSKWNIAPTGGGSNGNDEEDVPGDD